MFVLQGPRLVIGRRSDSDIVLSHRLASRQHAEVVREGDSWVLVDLQSTHGTFVNGERIERYSLKARDRIRLGRDGVELLFRDDVENADLTTSSNLLESEDLDFSVRRLASVLPEETGEHSELEKISCLLDFHYSFGKAFSADKTFHHILKSALQISGAERGFVLRHQGGEFAYALGLNGTGRTLSEAEFRTSRSVVDQVTRTGQPVFMTQGIKGDLAAQESIVAMNLRAIACLPLEAMSHESSAPTVMGILYLDSHKYMHSLSGLDEKLLTRLAGEAGNVLEKLELVETLAERQRMEQELALAEETQRALLPRSLPSFEPFRICAFCRPTRQLGGDFYDFIQVGSSELAGILADVSGKGIPAALLSSLTLGALNMEFRTSSQPGRVLNGVNQLLCQKTPINKFVTLFLFLIDTNGKGQYISAGHNTCYLYRAATGEVEDLPSGGIPLGMFPFAVYEPNPLELAPGDTLVVYSDGLTDAENRAGQEFGEEQLRELVRNSGLKGADSLESSLLAALDRFTQGAAQTDDITFLLIQNSTAAPV
ncbi:MAG TPA: SpoIIE family protein phosphatase [Bryobacteraceae bacterium]|nr:SpoIIE family protein phosphatase [Bryobacteraceae bacterium]